MAAVQMDCKISYNYKKKVSLWWNCDKNSEITVTYSFVLVISRATVFDCSMFSRFYKQQQCCTA